VLLRDESDLVLLFIRARIAQIIELPVPWMEATMMLHYAPGEEFLPHLDFLDTQLPGPAADVAERGQRVVTFLLALNEDYEGGETAFTELGRRWKGQTGSGLFFWNVEPDGRPDPRTRHAGLPPVNGEKWLLSQWVRARPVRS
jgi:prolyl 4-hydroxylase